MGHYLLPVLSYGIIGCGGVFSAASAASTASELSKQIQGAGSKVLFAVEGTRDVAVRAAEEAGWGVNGGGRVIVMAEGREWSVRVVGEDGNLGANLIDERERLTWPRITDRTTLEESLIILIYSSGTTGLPKGK
jgi:long-subunit acyl-CoA synthetase (AMP-forming)